MVKLKKDEKMSNKILSKIGLKGKKLTEDEFTKKATEELKALSKLTPNGWEADLDLNSHNKKDSLQHRLYMQDKKAPDDNYIVITFALWKDWDHDEYDHTVYYKSRMNGKEEEDDILLGYEGKWDLSKLKTWLNGKLAEIKKNTKSESRRINESDVTEPVDDEDEVIRFSINNVSGELQEAAVKRRYLDRFNIYLKSFPITIHCKGKDHKLPCNAHIKLYNTEVKDIKEELQDRVLKCSMGVQAFISDVLPGVGDGITIIIDAKDIEGNGKIEINNKLKLTVSQIQLDFKDKEIYKYI